MRYRNFCISWIVCFCLLSCEQGENVPRVFGDEISLSEKELVINRTGNQFSFDLFRQLSTLDSTDNLFVSPFSISCALGMVNNGASGITYQEIAQVMLIPDSVVSSLNNYHQKLIDGLPCLDSTVTVRVANSMWFNKEVSVKKQFTKKNSVAYKATFQQLDFSQLESIDKINGWVSQQTEGCIPEIIYNLSPNQLMVLVNCLYFQGEWEFPFEESETRKEQFFCADKTKENVDMMHQIAAFLYRKNDYFEMATFPYGNGSYAMTVLLPRVNKSWKECIDVLGGKNWETWMADSIEKTLLDVKLPKLVLKNEYKMNRVLSAMGMPNAFTTNADFSNLTDVKPVWIGKVVHASFLELNERETKASAVTGLTVTFESEPIPIEPAIPFYANRPFLLVIHETGNHTILFIGKVSHPNQ